MGTPLRVNELAFQYEDYTFLLFFYGEMPDMSNDFIGQGMQKPVPWKTRVQMLFVIV